MTAKRKRSGSSKESQRISIPKTLEQLLAKPEQFQDNWNRVVHVISKMRSSAISLQQASREIGIDSRTVIRLGKSALTKRSNGRYGVKSSDRLLRVLVVPAKDGLREIAVRDSREASLIGAYSDAVQKYFQTGDSSALQKLPRKHVIDANGKRVRLLTDLKDLDRLGSAGVLSFESLYARSA